MSQSNTTTDHGTIRKWVEKRGGKPATVADTEDGDDVGLLRIAFQNDDDLDLIEWDAFFDAFEQNKLAFLYQDTTSDGGTSRFCKFVARD